MKYIDQAKWFLNGFWAEGIEQESESIWNCTQKFIELDARKKKEGNELDEFEAHKFLETLGETLTVIKLREKLREIDLDANGKMALVEYLCFKYAKTVQQVLDSPQGDNQEEIALASAKLQAVQEALDEVTRQLVQQEVALEASKLALAQQRKAEEALIRAETELRAAVDDLHKQEAAYNTQVATLERKKDDVNSSTVTKSKAAAELAQLKQEDPLPLRKAKITQEAALRKVEKDRKAAEAATAVAEAKAAELEELKRKVERAVRETEDRVREAMEYLEQVKRKGGVSFGAIWWMERELKEAQKYLPKRKQNM